MADKKKRQVSVTRLTPEQKTARERNKKERTDKIVQRIRDSHKK